MNENLCMFGLGRWGATSEWLNLPSEKGSPLKGKDLLILRSILCYFRVDFFPSRKHTYIILTPLKPHFYIVNLGFTGVYTIFLFLLKNIDCGYSLEPPR